MATSRKKKKFVRAQQEGYKKKKPRRGIREAEKILKEEGIRGWPRKDISDPKFRSDVGVYEMETEHKNTRKDLKELEKVEKELNRGVKKRLRGGGGGGGMPMRWTKDPKTGRRKMVIM